jgi:hypothetical protein
LIPYNGKKNITSLIEIPLMQILDGHKEIMGGNKRFIEGEQSNQDKT